MKAVLACTSRFHIFDLAEALHKQGSLECLVTGYPKWKTKGDIIPEAKLRNYSMYTTLFMAAMKFGVSGSWAGREIEWLSNDRLDQYASRFVEDADVYVGVSGVGMRSGAKVQEHGGKFVCDRGAAHIEEQERLLHIAFEDAGLPYHEIDPRKVAKELQEYEKSDAVFVCSEFVREGFIKRGVPAEKVHSIRLGADVSKFQPCAPKSEKSQIVLVGQVGIQKGIAVLAKAVKLLKDPTKYRIVVAGTALPEAEKFLNEIGRAVDLEVKGHLGLTDLANVMSASHLLVLPSVQDGFGMVVAQAMACGTPALVSDACGAKEIVQENCNGGIFPSGNPKALAEAIDRLFEDRDHLISMGQNARISVQDLGGWDAYGTRAVELLRQLVEK